MGAPGPGNQGFPGHPLGIGLRQGVAPWVPRALPGFPSTLGIGSLGPWVAPRSPPQGPPRGVSLGLPPGSPGAPKDHRPEIKHTPVAEFSCTQQMIGRRWANLDACWTEAR